MYDNPVIFGGFLKKAGVLLEHHYPVSAGEGPPGPVY